MLIPPAFLEILHQRGITFFTGVPDSLLKHFLACLADRLPPEDHIISANEGNAVALAAGHYLATGQPALVYMQNSGLGNAVNPLLSLADPEVFKIPLLLLIGWRGKPGHQDEPQHRKQGRVTPGLLDVMEIPREELDQDPRKAEEQVSRIIRMMVTKETPFALLVAPDTFQAYEPQNRPKPSPYPLNREEALAVILETLQPEDVIISTTGKLSRELHEYRQAHQQADRPDFLNIGAMGHASQVALAVARQQPKRRVYCLDGDGAALMHLGGLAIAGAHGTNNFRHIILNNGTHDSVGGQPTAGFRVDFPVLAAAAGYRWTSRAETRMEITEALAKLSRTTGPALLEIRIRPGSRPDLGRPEAGPRENKKLFMKHLSGQG